MSKKVTNIVHFGLVGVITGLMLLGVGTISWIIAILIGAEEYIPLGGKDFIIAISYVIIFTTAGCIVGFFWHLSTSLIGKILITLLAISVVLVGCLMIVMYIIYS